MQILIVDDEQPARGELHFILENLEPEAEFFEAVNGEQALELIEAHPIDVVFLDINMPGMGGLAVASRILEVSSPPLVVFATAYNEHAIQAFELSALDYVVKPFDERRLAGTQKRIRSTLQERAALEEYQEALRAFLLQSGSIRGVTKIWGQRPNETWGLVDYKDILWIVAKGKKVFLHTKGGLKIQIRFTLKELEPQLAPHNIVRVHKSYLVNLDFIEEVVPWFSGTYLIHMSDHERTQIPMSRRYAAQLKQRTNWR